MTQISGHMVSLFTLLIAGSPAAQTDYPEKPIRMIVGTPPGSQPDTVARLLGQKESVSGLTDRKVDSPFSRAICRSLGGTC